MNEKNLCKSVKSVGLKQSMRKNLRHLRNLSFFLFPVISSFFLSFLYFADFRPVGLGG